MTYQFLLNIAFVLSLQTVNDEFIIQQDIDLIEQWSTTWKLPLSSSKCTAVRFTLGPGARCGDCVRSPYLVSGSELPLTNFHRDLGVFVSNDCSWTLHYISAAKLIRP